MCAAKVHATQGSKSRQ
uniref:Uncharacterized protein n=1 Tax=Arundo donax TaxID=35708 RepID=A0A0A8YD37_ARUDO